MDLWFLDHNHFNEFKIDVMMHKLDKHHTALLERVDRQQLRTALSNLYYNHNNNNNDNNNSNDCLVSVIEGLVEVSCPSSAAGDDRESNASVSTAAAPSTRSTTPRSSCHDLDDLLHHPHHPHHHIDMLWLKQQQQQSSSSSIQLLELETATTTTCQHNSRSRSSSICSLSTITSTSSLSTATSCTCSMCIRANHQDNRCSSISDDDEMTSTSAVDVDHLLLDRQQQQHSTSRQHHNSMSIEDNMMAVLSCQCPQCTMLRSTMVSKLLQQQQQQQQQQNSIITSKPTQQQQQQLPRTVDTQLLYIIQYITDHSKTWLQQLNKGVSTLRKRLATAASSHRRPQLHRRRGDGFALLANYNRRRASPSLGTCWRTEADSDDSGDECDDFI